MNVILIVLLLTGYFMSVERVKGMSSENPRNNSNAEGRSGWVSRARYYAPVAEVIIGFIGLSAIGFLIWQTLVMTAQTKQQTEALQRDAIGAIHSSVLELDKMFLDNAHLRPYFYSGQDISPVSEFYDEVLSIAEYQLNLFEVFWVQSYFARDLFTPEDWEAWEEWMSEGFADSPILCKHLHDLQLMYSEALVNFAVASCPTGTIQNQRQSE